jgi:hypothetical protein
MMIICNPQTQTLTTLKIKPKNQQTNQNKPLSWLKVQNRFSFSVSIHKPQSHSKVKRGEVTRKQRGGDGSRTIKQKERLIEMFEESHGLK